MRSSTSGRSATPPNGRRWVLTAKPFACAHGSSAAATRRAINHELPSRASRYDISSALMSREQHQCGADAVRDGARTGGSGASGLVGLPRVVGLPGVEELLGTQVP